MPASSALARQALVAARKVRVASHTSAETPICVFDLLQENYRDRIDLRFQAAPSMEGLYVRGEGGPSIIIVSSLRPSGRQRFTCAHELGHHEFGHGTSLDQLETDSEPRFDAKEFLADTFASFLLMPKLAVLKACAARGISVATASPIELYRIASLFGVGYATLLQHLSRTLNLLHPDRAVELRKLTPKKIREQILGVASSGTLHIVDAEWRGRAVDVQVSDLLILPRETAVEGEKIALQHRRHDGDLYVAVRTGISRIEHSSSGMANYVRVARSDFEGRGMFRHEEDCDE